MREIPQCWLTGQAAGTAAALAARDGVQPRAVDSRRLQALLRRRNVFLQAPAAVAETPVPQREALPI